VSFEEQNRRGPGEKTKNGGEIKIRGRLKKRERKIIGTKKKWGQQKNA